MKNQPLITVIVPVYNTAELLPKCIDSILQQTWQNIEVILVDDGSTDHCGDIIQQYGRKWPDKIVALSQVNSGQGAARNLALDRINGRFVTFVDSDDWIEPQMLACLYQNGFEHNADIVMCDFQTLDEDDCVTESYSSGEVFSENGCLIPSDEFPFLLVPQVTGKLFKSELFADSKHRFPVGIWYEDLALMPLLAINAKKVSKVPHYFYKYFKRKGSTTTSFTLKVLDGLKALDFITDYLVESGQYTKYRESLDILIFRTLYMTAVRIGGIQAKAEREKGYLELERYFKKCHITLAGNKYFKRQNNLNKLVIVLISFRLTSALYYLKWVKDQVKRKR